jgi:hypothetical protein
MSPTDIVHFVFFVVRPFIGLVGLELTNRFINGLLRLCLICIVQTGAWDASLLTQLSSIYSMVTCSYRRLVWVVELIVVIINYLLNSLIAIYVNRFLISSFGWMLVHWISY